MGEISLISDYDDVLASVNDIDDLVENRSECEIDNEAMDCDITAHELVPVPTFIQELITTLWVTTLTKT